jgi:hypothetical protein
MMTKIMKKRQNSFICWVLTTAFCIIRFKSPARASVGLKKKTIKDSRYQARESNPGIPTRIRKVWTVIKWFRIGRNGESCAHDNETSGSTKLFLSPPAWRVIGISSTSYTTELVFCLWINFYERNSMVLVVNEIVERQRRSENDAWNQMHGRVGTKKLYLCCEGPRPLRLVIR